MPSYDAHVFDITRVIQLAIAPVFMLTAVASIINALLGRLARAVDRRRVVDAKLGESDATHDNDSLVELQLLGRRIQLVLWAIGFAVLSALMVCLLIGTAFMGAYTSLDLSRTVAILFIASVVALTGCLLLFMREVFLAALSVHHNVRTRRGA
ncbi:MAG TPA: DUF2721 domain-containing protein [Usitatibacter sp.]|nr:DUF2721 domain-containing protein [Usitatibacter sp.]